jgi:transcriptional regulator with XRE-family HTH domain
LGRPSNAKTPVQDEDIGQRLKEQRKRHGLSQAEMAMKLGVHQSLVSEYERGTVRVTGTVLAAFARILKTSADELLGLKPSKDKKVPDERRFIRRLERIEKLPRRAKDALLKTIDTYLAGVEKSY